MSPVSSVLAVLAVVVILAAVLIYVVVLVWAGRNRLGSSSVVSGRRTATSSDTMARGFSYLHLSPRSVARRGGVHLRLSRAFDRIDAVDPHAAPRRIGEALAQYGLADVPAPPRGGDTGSDRVPTPPLYEPVDRPRDAP